LVPELFQVGALRVPTHEFFIGLGALAALVVYLSQAQRRDQIDERILWIALGALVSGAIVAKLSTAWQYVDEPGATLPAIWLHGGRSILGGLAGAYAGAVATKRLVGYRASTGDLFAPAVAVGMAIGRVGCFLTEQIGTATSLPWGIAVGPEVAARIPMCPGCEAGTSMHPSFLYEIGFHLVAFGFLWRFRDGIGRRGDLLKLYLLGYGLFRFGLEFVRGNRVMVAGMTGSQLFLLLTIPVLVGYFWRTSRRQLVAA
jgi:prolipoprotein diacylglyceryl transferase